MIMLEDINKNDFYLHLVKKYGDQLAAWCEPNWVICIPQSSAIDGLVYSDYIIESHILKLHGDSGYSYISLFCGESLLFEVTNDEPRSIICHRESDGEVSVATATIMDEYLVTYMNKVLHLLLLDKLLDVTDDSSLEREEAFPLKAITKLSDATSFLRSFSCHFSILDHLDHQLSMLKDGVLLQSDVTLMQQELSDLIIQTWKNLLRTHKQSLQSKPEFQDLLLSALDFYVTSSCHQVLWWHVCERCQLMDRLVSTRLAFLHSANLTPSQLGVPLHYYTPLPAAVVELATLPGVESAVGRLHCVHSSVELIQAQAKEARVNLHQYKDQDGDPELSLSESELVALLTTVVVQAQCQCLVSNIYYMTHFVFFVTEEQPLWKNLSLLRAALEKLMKMDITKLPPASKHIRKELSLQDLMQVSAEVESRFEGRDGSSRSSEDITALDLQLHQLTQQIQLSTQAAISDTSLTDRNSPARRSDRVTSSSPARENGKMQLFRDFLSNIPSTLRASLRRRQSQQRDLIQLTLQQ